MSLLDDREQAVGVQGQSLAILLEGLNYSCNSIVTPQDVEINSVSADSREVGPGGLFVALRGLHSDGHDFIDSALDKGCRAIVVSKGHSLHRDREGLCVIEVVDTYQTYGEIAAAYYGHPAREMNFIGITGTNGKTTVTFLLETVFETLEYSVGVIGTVNYRYRDREGRKRVLPAPFTTPEPLILQRLLREMADEGVAYVLMEVSSHALSQKRLGDVTYDIAVFTNLSHDHLDYHEGMEDYFQAKSLLFREHLKPDGSAVMLYGDEDEGENSWPERLVRLCQGRGIPYIKRVGYEQGDISMLKMDCGLDGTVYGVKTDQGEVEVHSSLTGRFNVANGMAAMAVALELGFDVNDIKRGLDSAQGAPGRVQHVHAAPGDRRPHVFVDYAHTPDALEKVLQALAAIPHNDLVCVFGCGGDRDKGKRAVMGRVAAELSDVVIVTDDNPRTEDPVAIIRQIVQGVKTTGLEEKDRAWATTRKSGEKGFVVQSGRAEAIHLATRMSSFNDIVVVAGKGHEKYQLTNEGKRFFDDVLEAQEALVAWNLESLERALKVTAESRTVPGFLGNVSTDTRNLKSCDIFVALRGYNFDGHTFLDNAVEAGVAVLIVEKSHDLEKTYPVPVLKVDDTLKALGDLAAYRRKLLASVTQPLVVGLTGSSGKTTVKEMAASIFMEHWPDGEDVPANRVLKTQGNFNNLVGLPLSLLPIGARHRVAILEMGMNSPGEIARLAEIAAPDISCINNIHPAHLEGLQSLDGVARAKQELFQESSDKCQLIVNLDDVRVRNCSEKFTQKKISFTASSQGLVYSPDLWATDVSLDEHGKARFQLHIKGEQQAVALEVPGEHNVANGLAAAAIGHVAGVPITQIVAGLEKFRAVDKRMMVASSHSGVSILNDTYNANPASMEAALMTLEQLGRQGSVAVLGDMLELGEASAEKHRELGESAARKNINFLAALGNFSSEIIAGAKGYGMDSHAVKQFEEKEDLVQWLFELRKRGELNREGWILVKASRGMQFETIVQGLKERV